MIPLLALPELVGSGLEDVAHSAGAGRSSRRHEPCGRSSWLGLYPGSAGLGNPGRARWPLSVASAVSLHRQVPAAGGLHRERSAVGDRHCAAHDPGGSVAGARNLPRRCGIGQQRVPSRARIRYRAFQRTAAGAVLYHRWGWNRLRCPVQ